MKFFTLLTLAMSASAAVVVERHHQGKGGKGKGKAVASSAAATTAAAAATATPATGAATRGATGGATGKKGGKKAGKGGAAAGGAAAGGAAGGAAAGAAAGAATGGATGGAAAATGDTVVLKEDGGVPGNECLTFRNNGEIVDAACVLTAADRQINVAANNLGVQRSFSNGFRPDLVNVNACIGFNGTHFKASDCADNTIEPVTFTNNQLVATSGACASGHDGAAQMTVDTTGKNCATYQPTTVTPTPP